MGASAACGCRGAWSHPFGEHARECGASTAPCSLGTPGDYHGVIITCRTVRGDREYHAVIITAGRSTPRRPGQPDAASRGFPDGPRPADLAARINISVDPLHADGTALRAPGASCSSRSTKGSWSGARRRCTSQRGRGAVGGSTRMGSLPRGGKASIRSPMEAGSNTRRGELGALDVAGTVGDDADRRSCCAEFGQGLEDGRTTRDGGRHVVDVCLPELRCGLAQAEGLAQPAEVFGIGAVGELGEQPLLDLWSEAVGAAEVGDGVGESRMPVDQRAVQIEECEASHGSDPNELLAWVRPTPSSPSGGTRQELVSSLPGHERRCFGSGFAGWSACDRVSASNASPRQRGVDHAGVTRRQSPVRHGVTSRARVADGGSRVSWDLISIFTEKSPVDLRQVQGLSTGRIPRSGEPPLSRKADA